MLFSCENLAKMWLAFAACCDPTEATNRNELSCGFDNLRAMYILGPSTLPHAILATDSKRGRFYIAIFIYQFPTQVSGTVEQDVQKSKKIDFNLELFRYFSSIFTIIMNNY